jgi:hypothetical protein
VLSPKADGAGDVAAAAPPGAAVVGDVNSASAAAGVSGAAAGLDMARFAWHVVSETERAAMLSGGCAVSTHELLHLLWFEHCVYFRCQMAGTNTRAERLSSVVHLCPVCLHKLIAAHSEAVGQPLDVEGRYRALLQFYERFEKFDVPIFNVERQWLRKRLSSK